MSTNRAEIGMCFPRTYPAALVKDVAQRLEAGGADQLWIIEDCFYTAGASLSAAALSVTDSLRVGLGIVPAVARNPAITAMEFATLCGLGPGRFIPGIGHGVQSWMEQMGVRTPSPLTTLEEVLVAVGRLLAGERVTMSGRFVHLDDVQLDHPPADPPGILAGVRGPKSMAVAGRAAGGVLLAEPASPTYVRWAVDHAGRPDDFHVAIYSALCVMDEREAAHRTMAPWLASILKRPHVGLTVLPFFDDLAVRYEERGVDGLATMPADWWAELGPIGTLDDALAHIAALESAGVHSIGLFPSPDVEIGLSQLDDVIALAGSR
ncbi:MAG TPA: LLM class flavin-dependent oxidoreductase [Jiangellaceae bacterium]|nr:LLM class flavin-dependent oxidoreductase [Jiangellaceae bacterium]